ncbi:MAG: hypothetical protein E7513_04000 [Ruminococcaceae bacterium]|nr:hypothetical protein [Oscillospiraceae bacterium]
MKMRILSLFLAMLFVFSTVTVASATQVENFDETSIVTEAVEESVLLEVEETQPQAQKEETAQTNGMPTESEPENVDEEVEPFPVIKGISPVSTGLKITIVPIDKAVKYRLFIKNTGAGSKWKKIGDTTTLSYIHKNLTNNTKYTYTVRALDKNGAYIGTYDKEGWSKTYLSTPKITAVESVYSGIRIKWNKVTGAENYKVYIKSGSSFKTLATTSSTSYTDTNVTSGKKYTYTVRCVSADGSEDMSFYTKNPKSVKFVKAPAVTSISNITNGSKITWGKVAGASKYRLFVKKDGTKSWTKVKDTSSLSATHTGLKNNKEYTYTVRALDSKGKYVSGYNSTGWSNKYLALPKLTNIVNTYTGVKISWNKVAGASKYKVYVKTSDGWKTKGYTTSTSFTDTSVKGGKSYTYTVRCVSADQKTHTSHYNKNGLTIKFVVAPKITKFENTNGGTKITWGKVTGASKYRLFVKKDGTKSWTKVKDTSSLSATHTGLKSNKEYTYTVRALNSKGKYVSGYYSTGWTNRYIAPPQITSISKSSEDMLLSWNSVANVASFKIYRKNLGGSWKVIGETSATTFTDTNPPKDTPYTYTLRCMNASGNLISSYISKTKYYYNGELANGKVKYDGNTYNFADGYIKQGYVEIDGNTYYYNEYGVIQKNGIVGNSKDGYRYADKNGKIDYTVRKAVEQNGVQWNVLDGKAYKVKTEADKTLYRALKEVDKALKGKKGLTKEQKLRQCYLYVMNAYTEKNPRIPHYTGTDWPIIYANDMFVRGVGNCCSYAACFAYMAKAIGYENVYACNSGGHGWAEINGLIYDPEWSRHHDFDYYAISYNANVGVDYKGAMSVKEPWKHVKI